ncbi:hypothetical protein [Rhodovulum sp. MB263]|uniref:hypothetical protein n=1 Tax=Rhodovulum sp. (strain MB263) TaxID=308754 RepID=UPI0012DB0501|nr:hypothetical protein [Rhodovulum sp. MB263]
MLRERFEISGDDDLDLRTEDEKARAAVTRWLEWQGHVGHLDRREQGAVWDAVRAEGCSYRRRRGNGGGASLCEGHAQAG